MAKVILLALKGKVKDEDTVFEDIPEDSPLPVLIGAGEILPALEEVVKELGEGEEREVELPPEKAFGERKKELIVIVPEREFRKRNIRPYVGMLIELNGRTGRVLSINSGRVTVDLNHPLAGKTVVYRVKAVKILENTEEAVPHLFKKFFGYEPESVKFDGGVLRVSYLYSKNARDIEPVFVSYLLSNVDEIKEVRMEQVYRRKSKEEAE